MYMAGFYDSFSKFILVSLSVALLACAVPEGRYQPPKEVNLILCPCPQMGLKSYSAIGGKKPLGDLVSFNFHRIN